MNANFSSANNAKPLRSNEYRVWRFGESAICRSAERAQDLVRVAARIDPLAHAVDANGARPVIDAQPTCPDCGEYIGYTQARCVACERIAAGNDPDSDDYEQ